MRAEKFFEFQGSRNLNTTPIDITSIEGDKYDYELVVFFEDEGVASFTEITFNNDTTSNYRSFHIRGDGSTVNANTTTTTTQIGFGGNSFSFPTLSIGSITGRSGEERLLNSLSSQSVTSGDTRIYDFDSYWKDTLNEITSMQISKSVSVTSDCHIILYQTPKETSQGGWEKVNTLDWSTESTEKSFTGLDGDNDNNYKIIYSGDQESTVQINNDATANYVRQRLDNTSGSVGANNGTDSNINPDGINYSIFINSATGIERLCSSIASNTIADQQNRRAIWYQDTITNITSLDITPSSSATATATLYRASPIARNENIAPYELIDTYTHEGTDFSAGHTFSFSGDDFKLIKLEMIGESSGANELRFQFNGDTSSIYNEQRVRGQNSTASANNTTRTYGILAGDTEVQRATFIIYPKTGTSRSILLESSYGENTLQKSGIWYEDSVTEITSLKVFGSTTATVSATFKLWGLR